jgi:hypothetical protein
MTTYTVTLELKTSWWKKFWRFFKVIKQREEFKLTLSADCFKEGDILASPEGNDLLILKKI